MKRFISILLVLVSICSISISSLAEGASINATQSPSLIKTFGATVASGTTGYINIRTAPNTGAGIVTSIDANSSYVYTVSTFTGVGTTNQQREWLYIHWGSTTGYVYARYFGGGTASTYNGTITGNSVRLRVGPSTSSAIIRQMNSGTRIHVLDTTTVSGWYRVTLPAGTGWVSSAYVNLD